MSSILLTGLGSAVLAAQASSAASCPGYEGDPRNQIVGTTDNDSLFGTPGPDVICGMGGRDRLFGNEGDDVLIGDSGDTMEAYGINTILDDEIDGGSGNDTLFGGNGSDVLFGWDGADSIHGDRGSDQLQGGSGPDVLSGGEGPPETEQSLDPYRNHDAPDTSVEVDTVFFEGGNESGFERRQAPLSLTLDGLPNDGQAGEGDTIEPDIEGVSGGSGDDLIVGDRYANFLVGLGGNDTILGGGGIHDVVIGAAGDDVIDLFDGNGNLDPSGSLPPKVVSVGGWDDRFYCDPSGSDKVFADWEDIDQGAADNAATCKSVIEPAHLGAGDVNGSVGVPVVCAVNRRCSGKLRLTWATRNGQRRAVKRFAFKRARKEHRVRMHVPKGATHVRLRVHGNTPALEITRRHRIRIKG